MAKTLWIRDGSGKLWEVPEGSAAHERLVKECAGRPASPEDLAAIGVEAAPEQVAAAEQAEQAPDDGLAGMTLNELRVAAEEAGVVYRVGMKKAELVAAIRSARSARDSSG